MQKVSQVDNDKLLNPKHHAHPKPCCAPSGRGGISLALAGTDVILPSFLQAVGIRYIGFRNEQAAGYAAAASGFLTGVPGVLLTVSGPGAVHGIAGLSHAQVNTWPMILLSGSAEQVSGLCSCLRPAG